jgi:hypothetical protein
MPMSEPKASFLLPDCKSDRFIGLTIKSLSAQTEPDFGATPRNTM